MAAPTRVTQQVVEVIRTSTTPRTRVTQQVVEVIRRNNNPGLQVTQFSADVLREIAPGNRAGRVSQVYTDTIRAQPPTAAWLSQVYTDTIRFNKPQARPGLKSWNVFDRTASFEVDMIAGTPTSAATELAVRNGQNLISLGNELLMFQIATDLGNNRFRLSNLLRGRFGTEQNMNSHSANEIAYFLSGDTIRRVQGQAADLNTVRYWKITGIGQFLESKAAITNINTGESLKPWAPVRITGSRDGSGNLTLTWVRRSRIGHERILVARPPVGETTELYRVQIISSIGVVVQTFMPTTASLSYLKVDQDTDFGGSSPDLFTVKIGQISETYGIGYENSELV